MKINVDMPGLPPLFVVYNEDDDVLSDCTFASIEEAKQEVSMMLDRGDISSPCNIIVCELKERARFQPKMVEVEAGQ